ncbi:guanylate kinase [Acetivibrio thermocellus AD2]|jgi:guanylate kinase|uniref:Guanylate kinase n=2 Tax=Acetivibrio thermocellus TaxID=1515 RepID=A0AB36TEI5_ACETH|nr:guanylate kinase [Acetivibrio thermocellus]ADU74009.1 guanylate kinase [Acetivibrio thermocellus DSM 1313]ALX07947.1 Guanylate kinase [Acetivibrio thermocellus AD2]ANV75693.1 Guanylate kinase [Acetivibrio thermocellus DSM 2360]EIC06145.1 Guanylate kinase [Acetivibrio thermocellus YS]NLU26807.1 guanylate kinase [Acetivibrio thermocellus]
MYREGLLVVVSGPSGAGKGTLLNLLKDSGDDNIRFSVSATTRAPRVGEVDGVNYFFKTKEEFMLMIENDELFEWVEYCDNFYGTPKKYIEDTIKGGYDCLLEIEVEGAAKVMKAYPECVSVFILPPSFEELRRRIEKRGTEDVEVVNKRLERAKKEIAYASNYDYIIVNDNLKDAVEGLRSIIKAEKLKLKRNRDVLCQFEHN